MPEQDDQNLYFADAHMSSDELLAKFYGRFAYPWQTQKFSYLVDADFETAMLNQDIGDWDHKSIPERPRIWIAGCGTNQAIFTALRFPKATIVGSDLSRTSLRLCAANAEAIGVSNLTLKAESINSVAYETEYDYIISTGVIHHNSDPEQALKKLAKALKPNGVLELMVYNRYHRIIPSAFQKVVRIFASSRETIDFDADLSLAKRIITSLSESSLLTLRLGRLQGMESVAIADELINPIEHSYTVQSLQELAANSGLKLLVPCMNQFDKMNRNQGWNLRFRDMELQNLYNNLPDVRRWQVTNLLSFDRSPMLWFYLQRHDAQRKVKSEQQICDEFLSATFVKSKTTQKSFILNADGTYRLSPHEVTYPSIHCDQLMREILAEIDESRPIGNSFKKLSIEPTFQNVNDARVRLTTSMFPYLKSVTTRY